MNAAALLLGLLLTVPPEQAASTTPGGAFWRNLVLPGWGSVYAKRPVRAITQLTLVGSFTGMSIWQHRLYKDQKTLYDAYRAENEGYTDPELKRVMDIFHSQRNTLVWWTGLFWMGSAIDIYVAEHHRDFNKASWEGFGLYPYYDGFCLTYHKGF